MKQRTTMPARRLTAAKVHAGAATELERPSTSEKIMQTVPVKTSLTVDCRVTAVPFRGLRLDRSVVLSGLQGR